MATETKKIVYIWEGEAGDLIRTTEVVNKGFDGLEKQTEKTGREMDKTTRKVRRTDASLLSLSKSIRTTTSGFTVLGRAGGKGSRILGNLAGGMTRAAASAGAAGIAMVGLGAGIALTIGAVGAISVGLARLTANARELRIEAEEFPGFVHDADIDRLVEVDDTLEATTLAIKGMGAAIVVTLAPAIEKGLVGITAFSMVVRDAPVSILKTIDAVMLLSNAFTRFMADRLNPLERLKDPLGAEAFTSLQSSIDQFKGSVSTASETVGDYIPQAEALIQTYKDTSQAAEDAARQASRKSEADRQAAADARELAAAQRAQASVLKIIAQATSDTLTPYEAIEVSLQEQLARLAELETKGANSIDVMTARVELYNRSLRDTSAATQQWADTTSASLGGTIRELDAMILDLEQQTAAVPGAIADTFGAVGDLASTMADTLAASGKRGARALAVTSKAAGIAQATINTYVGASQALALGPIIGPPAAAAQIALGLAQVAQIAAVPLPEAHIGTPRGAGAMAPDERNMFGRKVLQTELSTPGAVANSTATKLIDDANNGNLPGGGGQVITAVIGRSHLDTELDRSARSGTTRYSRNLRTNPHPPLNRGRY